MRTLYALALICLSVPAFASELDFDDLSHDATETGYWYESPADSNFGDDNTATVITPAAPKSDDQSVEANLYDAEAGLFGDDNTATIITPTPNSEDHSLEFDLGTGEDTVYQSDIVDLGAIPADAWF